MDVSAWQGRFDGLTREHGVPGASLAIAADDDVQTLTSGVLNLGTRALRRVA